MSELPRFENSRNIEIRAATSAARRQQTSLGQEANLPLLRLRSWGEKGRGRDGPGEMPFGREHYCDGDLETVWGNYRVLLVGKNHRVSKPALLAGG